MPGSRRWSCGGGLAAVVAGTVLGGAAAPVGAEEVEHRTVFTFTDRDITESSGLVDRGPVMFTVNDSGDGPVVYTVAKSSGDTVVATTYSSETATDVEALAPGRGGAVWVADIGDNNEERSSVSVFRVAPLGGREPRVAAEEGQEQKLEESVSAEKFDLVYPDSPNNAEALLVHPDTGRLYVVTKSVTGGTIYAAPERLDPGSANRLKEVGQVPGLVTDGSFLPDGKHIMLRSYGSAAAYTFPGLSQVADVDLPAQQQGEGLAISSDGDIYLSTEGAYADVLQILLPPAASKVLGEPAPDTALPPSAPDPAVQEPASSSLSADDAVWLWVAVGILVLTIAGWLLLTASRRGRGRGW